MRVQTQDSRFIFETRERRQVVRTTPGKKEQIKQLERKVLVQTQANKRGTHCLAGARQSASNSKKKVRCILASPVSSLHVSCSSTIVSSHPVGVPGSHWQSMGNSCTPIEHLTALSWCMKHHAVPIVRWTAEGAWATARSPCIQWDPRLVPVHPSPSQSSPVYFVHYRVLLCRLGRNPRASCHKEATARPAKESSTDHVPSCPCPVLPLSLPLPLSPECNWLSSLFLSRFFSFLLVRASYRQLGVCSSFHLLLLVMYVPATRAAAAISENSGSKRSQRQKPCICLFPVFCMLHAVHSVREFLRPLGELCLTLRDTKQSRFFLSFFLLCAPPPLFCC